MPLHGPGYVWGSLNQQTVVPPVVSPVSSPSHPWCLLAGNSLGQLGFGGSTGRCSSPSLAGPRAELLGSPPQRLLALSLGWITRFLDFFLHPRKWQRLDRLVGMLRGSFSSDRPQGCSWKNTIFFWIQRAFPTRSPMGQGHFYQGFVIFLLLTRAPGGFC